MTNEQIEKFVANRKTAVSIHFKDRQTVSGVFVQLADFGELRSKNLWRIVSNINIEKWNKTHDPNLSRIFNGMSFTRLSEEK
jgi:hypothetical protein